MKPLDVLAATLVIVGGLNWGLVALAEFDLVAWIFGEEFGTTNAASRVVYGLVGVAAAYGAVSLLARRRSDARASPRDRIELTRRPPMKRIRPILMLAAVSAAVATGVVAGSAGATAEQSPAARENIVQTAVAAGKFDTLVSLVKKAGLARTLQGAGPFTVFAPSDRAFAKVPKSTLAALGRDRAKLRAVLLYHVAAGRLTAAKVSARRSIKTLNGQRLRVRVRDGKVFVGGARVITPDVKASNGVIHAINRVLIPG